MGTLSMYPIEGPLRASGLRSKNDIDVSPHVSRMRLTPADKATRRRLGKSGGSKESQKVIITVTTKPPTGLNTLTSRHLLIHTHSHTLSHTHINSMEARGDIYHCPYPGCTQAFTALRDWNAHTRRERFNSINARVVFAVRERTGNERVHLSTNPDAEQQRHYSRTVDRILASLGALDLLPFDKTSAAIDKCSLDQLQKITKSKETSVRESQWGQLSLNNNNNNSREENTPPTPVPETLPNSPGTPYLTSHTRTQWMLANVSDRDASPSPLGMDTETNSRGQIDVDYMEAGKGGNDDNSAVKCQWEARLRRRGCSTFVRTGDCDSILSEQALARHYLQHAMTQIRTYYTMTCPVKDCEMLLFQRTEDETSEDVISKHNSLMHRTIPSSRRKASTSTPSTTKDMSSKRYRSPGSKSAISNTAIGVSKQPRRQKSRSKTKEPSLTKETPLTTRRGVVMSRMTAETVEDSCESDVNEVEGLGGVSAKRRANQDHESQSHRRKTRNTFGNDQETPDLRIKSENTS